MSFLIFRAHEDRRASEYALAKTLALLVSGVDAIRCVVPLCLGVYSLRWHKLDAQMSTRMGAGRGWQRAKSSCMRVRL